MFLRVYIFVPPVIHCSALVAGNLQAFVSVSCPPGPCDKSVTISSLGELKDLPACALLEYSYKTLLVEMGF